jgi:hypothetical protein
MALEPMTVAAERGAEPGARRHGAALGDFDGTATPNDSLPLLSCFGGMSAGNGTTEYCYASP